MTDIPRRGKTPKGLTEYFRSALDNLLMQFLSEPGIPGASLDAATPPHRQPQPPAPQRRSRVAPRRRTARHGATRRRRVRR